MKVSIITVTYNSASTVRDTIESVLAQTYSDIEYIIVDGASKDNTLDIVNEYKGRIATIISEPDKGIYDAMNKGIQAATGDVIGILNSDDFFTSDDVIDLMVLHFKNDAVDAVYGDVHFVNSENLDKCIRYYSSAVFRPRLMRLGFMPAHPSCYIRKKHYQRFGLYDTSYKIGADFDLLLRYIYLNKLNFKYLQKDFVTMRTGGASTNGIKSHIQITKDHLLAFKKNNVRSNLFYLSLRYLYKLKELI